MSRTFLHGLGVSNFRGIGDDLQLIGPFSDLNFFIGPNNSGKSTVLGLIAKYLHAPARSTDSWRRQFDQIDVRLGKNASEVKLAFGVQEKLVSDAVCAPLDALAKMYAATVIQAAAKAGLVWVCKDDSSPARPKLESTVDINVLKPNEWQRLWNVLTHQTGGSLERNWYPQVLAAIAAAVPVSYPGVAFIPAIRQLGPKDAGFEDYSGKGLIDRLAEYQSPPHDEQHKKRTFERINEFLRSVTESPNATIEVPYDRRHLLVHMDGRVLPLDSLGTGIHEVVMIAAFCTMLSDQIVCIEEPEIHLHPILQRRLMRFLRANTTNQYFVATHSAALIDAEPATIFRVSLRDGGTLVEQASDSHARFEVCRQLGYRASDILQANSIVWVEGPTDRIYVNSWLKAVAPDLVEGVDYSVMFYGGRLLSHLSPADSEISDFINLTRLNRNTAIVIDSDKSSSSKPLNGTKQRVISEIGAGFSWVTAGREIENYLAPTVVSDFLVKKYGGEIENLPSTGRYDDRLAFKLRSKLKPQEVDKLELARAVQGSGLDLEQLDLRKQVVALAEFIRSAVI